MPPQTPYLDTDFYFDRPASLAQAGVFDTRRTPVVMGSAIGHYRAHTVRESLQYFDCDLQFPEPLSIHKVLPDSLCIVHVLDGEWQHSIDGTLNRYTTGKLHALGLSESMEAQDQLPPDSHARMAGLRIAEPEIPSGSTGGRCVLYPAVALPDAEPPARTTLLLSLPGCTETLALREPEPGAAGRAGRSPQ